jgi:hypothetical protein
MALKGGTLATTSVAHMDTTQLRQPQSKPNVRTHSTLHYIIKCHQASHYCLLMPGQPAQHTYKACCQIRSCLTNLADNDVHRATQWRGSAGQLLSSTSSKVLRDSDLFCAYSLCLRAV